MLKDTYRDLQYNSCVSRGICSINPRVSALQIVLILYLKIFAKYAKEIKTNDRVENFILNTLPLSINNINLNDESFLFAVKNFKKYLPKLIKNFYQSRNKKISNHEKKDITKLFDKTNDILDSIKYGENILNENINKYPQSIRNLYNIILVILKDLSINLLELKNLKKDTREGFQTIVEYLNLFNDTGLNPEELKAKIKSIAKVDYELMKSVRYIQEERYGNQTSRDISYSTDAGKAVLIVGSDIKELEDILNAFKDEDIDIYTHDEMILAHTFPKFSEYPRLKGHFGQGFENCLIDFAKFPGPIILTKNSLHNIENFYRGLLFTTDYTSAPKGIIKINNNNFSEVIKSAKESKGFKKGKTCETVNIGYNYEETISKINEKIEGSKYSRIIILGLNDFSSEQEDYFKNLIKLIPNNILIISFFYSSKRDNFIHINSCYDNLSWTRILDFIIGLNIPITVFIPKCMRGSFSQIIYYSGFDNIDFYIDICKPILLNPSLMQTFSQEFGIKKISTQKKDVEEITKDK